MALCILVNSTLWKLGKESLQECQASLAYWVRLCLKVNQLINQIILSKRSLTPKRNQTVWFHLCGSRHTPLTYSESTSPVARGNRREGRGNTSTREYEGEFQELETLCVSITIVGVSSIVSNVLESKAEPGWVGSIRHWSSGECWECYSLQESREGFGQPLQGR